MTHPPGQAKKGWIALAAWAIAGAGASAPAASQSVLQFEKWMQAIERRSQSVQRNLAAKDSVAALADAQELSQLYKLTEDYLSRRLESAEAAKLAHDGGDLADSLVQSLRKNDFDSASRSANSMTRACRECHINYKPLDP